MHYGFLLMKLHMLFALATVVGVILFILWANKNLGKAELKKLCKTLIIVGIVGAVLTCGAAKKMRGGHHELSAEKKAMILEVLENNDVDMDEEQLDAVMADLKELKKEKKGSRRGVKWGR
jgi:Co/Zn/Cd efflux system component